LLLKHLQILSGSVLLPAPDHQFYCIESTGMSGFVVIRTVDGSAATIDGEQVHLNATDSAGLGVKLIMSVDQAYNAVLSLAVAGHDSLKRKGAADPVFQTRKVEVGISAEEPHAFVQSVFFQDSGSLSFELSQEEARYLRDSLEALLEGKILQSDRQADNIVHDPSGLPHRPPRRRPSRK
jgi:hypothetical protein